jgi:1-acyl-sn-glycerol-3-phosphate acyltransferase
MKPIAHIVKRGWIISIVIKILRLFKKPPVIINEAGDFPDQAIFLINHASASGPITLSLYFPKMFAPWGHYQMTEGYKKRVLYLAKVFYQQKLGYSPFVSWLIAIPFALISKGLYNGISLIPSYPDIRVRSTIRISVEHLSVGNPIIIFPEDSTSGYLKDLTAINKGFIALSEEWYRKTKKDIPVYPAYFHKNLNIIKIEKPVFLKKMFDDGQNRDQIADWFLKRINQIGQSIEKEEEQTRD